MRNTSRYKCPPRIRKRKPFSIIRVNFFPFAGFWSATTAFLSYYIEGKYFNWQLRPLTWCFPWPNLQVDSSSRPPRGGVLFDEGRSLAELGGWGSGVWRAFARRRLEHKQLQLAMVELLGFFLPGLSDHIPLPLSTTAMVLFLPTGFECRIAIALVDGYSSPPVSHVWDEKP